VIPQVWRSSRQAMLARLLNGVVRHPLEDGASVGVLLARAGTSDIADAHAALVAQHLGVAVLTADVDDLNHLADHLPGPRLQVVRCP
jgi:hypothetical protein